MNACRAFLCTLVVSPPSAYLLSPGAGQSASASSTIMNRVSTSVDRASSELERAVDSVRSGNSPGVKAALQNYSRQLTSARTDIARLRVGESEYGFVTSLLDGLDVHISRLEALKAKVHPNQRSALSEAIKQLRRTLQLLTQKVERTSRSRYRRANGIDANIKGSIA